MQRLPFWDMSFCIFLTDNVSVYRKPLLIILTRKYVPRANYQREKIIVTVSHVKTCIQGRLYMYHFLPHAVKMSNIFWERKVLINDAIFIIVFLAWAGKKMVIKQILWNEKGSVFRTEGTPKLIDCLKKSSKCTFYYHHCVPHLFSHHFIAD